MHRLKAASFDLFSRYSHLYAFRHRHLGPDPVRILDVGDPFGTIAPLFPGDSTFSLDVYADKPAVGPMHQHLLGSGFELPFADGTFDLVASHDVFEHLPPHRRNEFVQELMRVSRGPALLVAPFDDPRTELCEAIVNSQFVTRVGRSLPALDEHADFGLPDLQALRGWLHAHDIPHAVHGDGWLYHWLAFYLIKASLVAEGALNDLRRLDTAINELLQEQDHQPPHYRRTVVLRPGVDELDLPALQSDEDGGTAEVPVFTRLALELTGALPFGQNPLSRGSAVEAWIDGHVDADGPIGQLAQSMRTAFDAVRQPAPGAEIIEPRPTSDGRKVSVVTINLDGAAHLRTCLDSLAAQDYPRELTEVIVVDNGSTDGSLDILAEEYPWVRVLPQGRNTGFAPAVTTGAMAATGECIALINNDMRADPSWLRELVQSYAPEDGYVCVAGQILSWEGDELDFGEGAVNFYGMGYQIGFGTPIDRAEVQDGKDLLFACGGSMLVGRDLYLNSGGFDPKFFAYFEDVDFGWRLWLMGYKVRMAASAVTFHRLHGTSARFPQHQRILLYERNALRSIIKNYEEHHLNQTLGPALMLLIERAIMRGKLDPAPYVLGADAGPTEEVDRITLAHLHAVGNIVDDLDELMAERDRIQRLRRRGDDEIIPLFGHPFQPVLSELEYISAQRRVVANFAFDPGMRRQRASQLLVVANEEIGDNLRGPSVRALEIARALAPVTRVTIAVPGRTGKEPEGVEFAVYEDERELRRLALEFDIVLVQGYALRLNPGLADTPGVLVADLYDPWLFEDLEIHDRLPGAETHLQVDVSVMAELLDKADFFICASERQRDYWLGMLSARGRVDRGAYGRDPSLRALIDVVPFGLPDREPRHLQPVLKGVHPAVGENDRVVLWGGGTWDWLDPVSVIDAFHAVVRRVPDAKLYFLGRQLAGGGVPDMHMADLAVRRAEELGLLDRSVIFGDWAPYELREAFLLEADVAVTAARDLAETRLAFRSRVLDYLWAGLPVVCTDGDVLADEVRNAGAGLVVPPGDVPRLAEALVRMLENPVLRAECAASARHLAEGFSWGRAVEPLRRLAHEPWRWQLARQIRSNAREVADDAQILLRADAHQIRDLENRLASTSEHLSVRLEEIGVLRRYAGELEATIAHQDKRLDLVRKSPLMPLFRRAKNLIRRRPAGG